ncbi:hypothetical protein HZS_5309 [Henneguya salminicola]|nr:hypothetical protein HZS_5309 [Henneguya salminicola]
MIKPGSTRIHSSSSTVIPGHLIWKSIKSKLSPTNFRTDFLYSETGDFENPSCKGLFLASPIYF